MLRIRTSFADGSLRVRITDGTISGSITISHHEWEQARQPLRLLKNKLDELDQRAVEFQTKKGNHD